jgi:hypothetical protein
MATTEITTSGIAIAEIEKPNLAIAEVTTINASISEITTSRLTTTDSQHPPLEEVGDFLLEYVEADFKNEKGGN